jgi:uracil-DNA glycosylase family 4
LYEKGSRGWVPPPILPLNWHKIRLLIQGEAPGKEEIDKGLPFVGKAGWWLWNNLLGMAGVTQDETICSNTLLCLPPINKQGDFYPIGDIRKEAEKVCAQYSVWAKCPRDLPLLLLGAKAATQGLGVPNISEWHGHVVIGASGRITGCTFHPAAVMRRPDLLPVVVNETRNLLDAARNPALLRPPEVWKHQVALGLDKGALAFDLEWDDKKQITIVGTGVNEHEACSTYEVEWGLDTIKTHKGCLVGHNIIDADFPIMQYAPQSFAPDRVFDTKVAAHLVHPHLAELGLYDLRSMVSYYEPNTNWKEQHDDALAYNGKDTAFVYRLYEHLKHDLDATEQWHLVEKQQRLAHMAAAMRSRGIAVDSEGIRTFHSRWTEMREGLKRQFPFNPNAPAQVVKWAQEQGIDIGNARYETLEKIAGKHEIIDKLIAYKDEGKAVSTWFDDEAAETGFIHPSFNVTGTAVARFSCASPNCQNIPPHLRHLIVPRSSELALVSFDFSQIENRCVAFLAGDNIMLADFQRGMDIHRLVAARMFRKDIGQISEDERRTGKITVHATNYGETAYHLGERLFGSRSMAHVSSARKLQNAYFAAYPKTRDWQIAVQRRLDSGDIALRNPFGRNRFVYAHDSHSRMKRGCHFLGCSTAADIVNQRALDVWTQCGLLPIMVIHDELIYEMPRGNDALRNQVKSVLEAPVPELGGMIIPTRMKEGDDAAF